MIPSVLNRFGKRSRLLDANAFSRVFDKAKRSRDNWFTVLCRRNDLEVARLGLAISKKHCRKATQRNRIKRVVRESFRHHQNQLMGLDIVVMNKSQTGDATNDALFDSLSDHWKRCARAASNGQDA